MKSPQLIDLTPENAAQLLWRVKNNCLQQGDYEIIEAMVNTIAELKESREKGKVHINRLLKIIFGPKTEKKNKVLPKNEPKGSTDNNKTDDLNSSEPANKDREEKKQADTAAEGNFDGDSKKKKAKGHGRNGAKDFVGADKETVSNSDLKPGDPCLFCNGKVYDMKRPGVIIHFRGQAPIKAKIWKQEKLRCNLCGAIFKADLPDMAKGEKYDETAISMIALSRYGFGIPFYRLQHLQACMGIPLPASTQWDKVEIGADRIYPAFEELKRQGAQGSILHNDDTTMKVLELMKENEQQQDTDSRKGMFTSGIVSIKDENKIVLFFTGRNHAGENIADILNEREPQRPPPIQMCDALSRNFSEHDDVILTHCNSHSRRKFVEVADNYPDECSYVLDVFSKIYENDAIAKKEDMSDQQRLYFHQEHSGPFMDEFSQWLNSQFEDKKVEPNSSLGEAISYSLNHWPELTRFLDTPGAPLDNNICEQALKRAILHRKNSLFYKTLHGAYVGDMYMSLIHTCILNDINPFDYLTALQVHSSEVFKNPGAWLPWNYEASILNLPSNRLSSVA